MPRDFTRSSLSLAGAGGSARRRAVGLGEEFVGVVDFLGIELAELDELRTLHRQLEVEDIVAAGEEAHPPRFGLVEVGVDAEDHLLVEDQHLGLVLGDGFAVRARSCR